MERRRAWLGLGGNIGNVRAAMAVAIGDLGAHPQIEVEAVSALYATPPWGKVDQPDFLNAVVQLRTGLDPDELLEACLATELRLKRVRSERWGPRTIDIDILVMEDTELDRDGLTIPHARLSERAFALAPLADLAPDLIVAGKAVSELLRLADANGIRRVASAKEWYRKPL